MIETPNVADFVQAQKELRMALGCPVIFLVPNAPEWPEGTKIDEDTGLPYNSLAKRENAPFTETTKTCLLILKQGSPLRPQADTQTSPLGEGSNMDIIVDLAEGDYPDVEEAAEMLINGLEYRIREFKPFAMAGVRYRWLVYGQEK